MAKNEPRERLTLRQHPQPLRVLLRATWGSIRAWNHWPGLSSWLFLGQITFLCLSLLTCSMGIIRVLPYNINKIPL